MIIGQIGCTWYSVGLLAGGGFEFSELDVVAGVDILAEVNF